MAENTSEVRPRNVLELDNEGKSVNGRTHSLVNLFMYLKTKQNYLPYCQSVFFIIIPHSSSDRENSGELNISMFSLPLYPEFCTKK